MAFLALIGGAHDSSQLSWGAAKAAEKPAKTTTPAEPTGKCMKLKKIGAIGLGSKHSLSRIPFDVPVYRVMLARCDHNVSLRKQRPYFSQAGFQRTEDKQQFSGLSSWANVRWARHPCQRTHLGLQREDVPG